MTAHDKVTDVHYKTAVKHKHMQSKGGIELSAVPVCGQHIRWLDAHTWIWQEVHDIPVCRGIWPGRKWCHWLA